MHVLIVHCHPEPASFNGALTEVAAGTLRGRGHDVEICDLYAEGFDPRESPGHYRRRKDVAVFAALNEQRHAGEIDALPAEVNAAIERLERADLIIFQFPLWWHAPPAMLKGWLDRVFVYGRLYSGRVRYDRGHFRGKRAIVSVTAGAPERVFGADGRGGDIDLLLWPLHYSLHYIGFSVLPPFTAFGIQGGGRDVRYLPDDDFHRHLETLKAAWAERLETVEAALPLRFPGWADWDESGVLKPGRGVFHSFGAVGR